MDSVVQRQPEDPAGLPPEVGTTIRAAQAELARAVQIANLTNDPLRHVLDSLSVSLGALHRLFVDGSQTIAQTMRQPIDQALIVDRLGSEAARAMDAHAAQFLHRSRIRSLVIGAGLLIAVAVFCGGFGYWRGYADGWGDRTGLESSVGAVLKDKPEDARLWAELMKWNPISEEVSRCTPMTAGEAHRKACQVFMWMEAPKVPTGVH